MKIVLLSYLHGFGGAEKQLILLANAMAERGHSVVLISICVNNNVYVLDKRIKYRFIPDRNTGILRVLYRYNDIKKELIKEKPDITINFWFQSAYLTALMSKDTTGQVLYAERGDPGDVEYSGTLGLVRKLILPRIDKFVFQSKGAQSFFDNTVIARSTIIPNPVSLNKKYADVTERRKVIVTVGRLHPQKNQKILIDAFALIAAEFPEYTLEIYGDGELRIELLNHIIELNLSDRIFLKGTSARIHSLIYDASLFVLSSNYEGLPNALIEAMALGIPCVSTDCKPGGAREIIRDGIDGYIVPRNNAIILGNTIKKLLKDKKKLCILSSNAKKSMENFNSDIVYNKWEKFLGDIN